MLERIIDCQAEIINTIKLLLYKEDESILEKVDFDDDDVFLEPLLFTYFNSKETEKFTSNELTELMHGYFIKKKSNHKVQKFFNKHNISYIPNIGYFNKNDDNPFESINLIEGTKIEIIKYHLSLLDYVFSTANEETSYLEQIIIDDFLFQRNIPFLSKALCLIKQNLYKHYQLIEQCCKKIVLFKTDSSNTNSFATINAHGIAFLNVYQESYNLVFFIDDIAHQTGHIILTTLLYDRKKIFKIDENQNIGEVLINNDYRSFYTLFHAMYTYYTTFICLNACLENDSFNVLEEKEAIARIGFYINKCSIDIGNFEKFISFYKVTENVLTNDGIEIYMMIKEEYMKMKTRWNPVISKLNYDNQPYNFTFDIFVENNK